MGEFLDGGARERVVDGVQRECAVGELVDVEAVERGVAGKARQGELGDVVAVEVPAEDFVCGGRGVGRDPACGVGGTHFGGHAGAVGEGAETGGEYHGPLAQGDEVHVFAAKEPVGVLGRAHAVKGRGVGGGAVEGGVAAEAQERVGAGDMGDEDLEEAWRGEAEVRCGLDREGD